MLMIFNERLSVSDAVGCRVNYKLPHIWSIYEDIIRTSRMQEINRNTSLSWLPHNKSLPKLFVLFCGISVLVIYAFCLRRTTITDRRNVQRIQDRSISQHRATMNQLSNHHHHYRRRHHHHQNILRKNEEQIVSQPEKKLFIAFDYWEQLTMATNHFFDLTALAAYAGRHVVVPFVKDSSFFGSPKEKGLTETLELYYNVSALNRTLRSRGHGTLISWKEFQDVCQGKLDVLVYFDYTSVHFDYTRVNKTTQYNQGTRAFIPCNNRKRITFQGFNVARKICMNVFAVDSVEKFENEVIENLPCVGLAQWRGIDNKYPFRAQFNLSSVVTDRLYSHNATAFFNSKLLHVARDFIAKNLSAHFVSAQIRAEKILKSGETFRNFTAVEKCILQLTGLVQRQKNTSTAPMPVFLATDFADYGSSSKRIASLSQNNAKSLMKILAPLKPVIFQPSAYNLTDRGAVAIVEMNILVSGERLFVVGGGSFQEWLASQFLTLNNIDQNASAKCQHELCNSLCAF